MVATMASITGSRPEQAVIPNVSGLNEVPRMTKEQAMEAFNTLGFNDIEIVEEFSDEVEVGYVIKQNPIPGFDELKTVDKVFAICDYMLLDRVSDHSRHIYDLYKLLDKVILDDNLKMLINDVRKVRKENEKCYSAQDNININELLNRIVKENIYKKDYQNITEKLLYKVIKYEEAIKAIEKIIDSKIFE